jgi:hypothetical protein
MLPALILERRERYQLLDFEEVCGEFRRFEVRKDQIALELRYSRSIVFPVSSKTIRVLEKLKAGDMVGILCTGVEKDSLRVRLI